jgi:hypothetical protein
MMSAMKFTNGQRKVSAKFVVSSDKKRASQKRRVSGATAAAALLGASTMQGCQDPVPRSAKCNPMNVGADQTCKTGTHCAPDQ